MFNTLRSYFRTKRALRDAIAEQSTAIADRDAVIADQNGFIDKLAEQRDRFVDQLDAANAQLAKVTDEANISLQRIEAQAAQIADIQHCYEQCEIDRQALADERNAAVKERDEIARSFESLSKEYSRSSLDMAKIHELSRGYYTPPEVLCVKPQPGGPKA
jgi:chromosome segregation ATPase